MIHPFVVFSCAVAPTRIDFIRIVVWSQDNDESDFEAEDSDGEDDFDGEMESDEVPSGVVKGFGQRKHQEIDVQK